MANNTINISFEGCELVPSDGFKIFYRPVGDMGAYREAPQNFTTSPAEWIDTMDPLGTDYEGYIQGDCGSGKLGPAVTFVTDGGGTSSSGSGGSGSGSELPPSETSFLVSNFMDDMILTDITPAFYLITIGALPLEDDESARGEHAGYAGVISVTFTGSGSGKMRLFINGIMVECVNVTGAGTFDFQNLAGFVDTDDVLILASLGVC